MAGAQSDHDERGLVTKITLGTATRADLTAGGATRVIARDACSRSGQDCANDIYAVSLASEFPSGLITWFQAQEACANAGKRLPTSAEWQVGASGTPDPGPDDRIKDCNSASGAVSITGARSACVSALGAFDMVGNLTEWVADWLPLSPTCTSWGGFSNDEMCLAGASETNTTPGAVVRGGTFNDGSLAGPLSVGDVPAGAHRVPSSGFAAPASHMLAEKMSDGKGAMTMRTATD
jgi:formylglycine-generating enzyme required for sulfatase activity